MAVIINSSLTSPVFDVILATSVVKLAPQQLV